MLNRSRKLSCGSMPANPHGRFPSSKSGLIRTAVSVLLILALQSGCLLPWFKKRKTAPVIPPIVRVAFLPFNAPAADKDLRWAALAAPAMMVKVSERARDLEVVPLWEAMPAALEAAGASRTFNRETGASVAIWLSAKWSAIGEFSTAKRGVSMMIDFIPAKSTLVPFRFMKTGRMDSVGSGIPGAFNQFLRYLAARPLVRIEVGEQSFSSLRNLAEALDREYGWFVEAQPGKAQQLVLELAKSDERLARLLFNPAVYPAIAPAK
jgi:hypothetical protein